MKGEPKILLILVYFGEWPSWIQAFIASCRANPTIDWLIFNDCETLRCLPNNVRLISISREHFTNLAEKRLGMSVRTPSNRKLCDFRPAYGVIFSDYIDSYDFWGHCDIDIIWGSIRSFYNKKLLDTYDVISTRKSRLAGHFTIFRNIQKINLAFRKYPGFDDMINNPAYCWFDEKGFSDIIHDLTKSGALSTLWDAYRLNYVYHVDNRPSLLSWCDRYSWRSGHLYSDAENGGEIMYLHFMNWKDSLHWCSLQNSASLTEFKIDFSSILLPSEKLPMIYKIKSQCRRLSNPKYFLLCAIRQARRIMLGKTSI